MAVSTRPTSADISPVVETDCAQCGMRFGITTAFRAIAQQSQQNFYCPLGHSNYYPKGECELDQARRQAREAAERTRLADAEAARLREALAAANHAATVATKKLRRVHVRVHAGVCPHCNRTFKQLAAHMASKHEGEK